MSDFDLKLLKEHLWRLRAECDTPEKSKAQLQREGLLDEAGCTAARYRDPGMDSACH